MKQVGGAWLAALLSCVALQGESLTWQQIRDRFESSNPTLAAARSSVEETRTSEIDIGNWINMPYYGNDRPGFSDEGEPLSLDKDFHPRKAPLQIHAHPIWHLAFYFQPQEQLR